MRIELLLQIAIATLTALGTLLLGMGERQLSLPLIAVVVSASSVYLTDISGWLRLNPRVANIAGSTAVVIFVWDFLERFGEETQLLAVANLLIYLQFVLLYQKKSVSTYWLLALLSLLQVAIATALNFELIFGMLLGVYLICGLAALGLFFFYREIDEFDRAGNQAFSETLAGEKPRRWPLPLVGPSVQTAWQHSDPADVIGWRFIRQTTLLTTSTVGVAMLFFFAVPRMGQSTWQAPVRRSQNVIGASNEVRLDDFGPITENPEIVMRVELYRGNSGQQYTIKETPLFRGPVLAHYNKSVWKQANDDSHSDILPEPPSSTAGLVRQVIRMRPLGTDPVYCVAPISGVRGAEEKQLYFNRDTQQLGRIHPGRDQTIEVYSSGFTGGRQSLFIPNSLSQNELDELKQFSSSKLKYLASLAGALVAHIKEEDALARARTLTNHLHDSGLYQYSLNIPRRNPQKDPIEDFVSEHKQGHCEYFASALALMLRSVKIPSRVVLGFNGGEYNSVGGFYQVRQLHAHAWVEAYLAHDQLPASLRDQATWSGGGWITLDPTPGSAGAISRIGVTSGVPSFRQIADYARYLWSSYIMGLDSDRQLRAIYAPIGAWFLEFGKDVVHSAAWQASIHWLRLPLGMSKSALLVFAAMVAAACTALLVLFVLRARLAQTFRCFAIRLGLDRLRLARSSTAIGFYRRLEVLLARFDLTRPRTITQQEFARLAARSLATRGLPAAVAAVPLEVTEAFYAVRFGRRQLDKQQTDAVEQALGMLDRASLARPRSGRRT